LIDFVNDEANAAALPAPAFPAYLGSTEAAGPADQTGNISPRNFGVEPAARAH
jgi:hypothetical protein